jgi:ketosteroid isomerase-like protein
MSAAEIGGQLAAMCREGRNIDAINELYSDDIVSVEAAPMEGMDQTMTGKAAILGKNQWWSENHEVHGAEVTGPYAHGDDRFALRFTYDITNKPSGQRNTMDELAVFTVRDGKIAREEFFYSLPA